MILRVFQDKRSLAEAAAHHASFAIRDAIAKLGSARIIAATGTSQIEFLESLTSSSQLDWERVELFHLDEYVGLPFDHPASFRKYITERLIKKTGIRNYHLLDGESNPAKVIKTAGSALAAPSADVAFVGIGENGHLAFNDPPADFQTEEPYILVNLDEACRRQQVGEGWFGDLSEVPKQAISMSIKQILKSKQIICIVPDDRKARAVQACFEGQISPMFPASILRTHAHCAVFLDRESASLLNPETLFGSAPDPSGSIPF